MSPEERGAQPQDEPAMLIVTDVIENEDGSATYTFDIDDISSKKITELGLEFILTCAAYELDIADALNHLSKYGKSLEVTFTTDEVEELLNEDH
jgi:hypothetical protein